MLMGGREEGEEEEEEERGVLVQVGLKCRGGVLTLPLLPMQLLQ